MSSGQCGWLYFNKNVFGNLQETLYLAYSCKPFCRIFDQLQIINRSLASFVNKPKDHRLHSDMYVLFQKLDSKRFIRHLINTWTEAHTDKHITGFYHDIFTAWQRQIIQQIQTISITSEDMKCNTKCILEVLLLRNDAIYLRKKWMNILE